MDTMKLESLTLYWPMAETEDGQSLFTQEAAMSVEQCYQQFDIWENHYHYKLKYACYDTFTDDGMVRTYCHKAWATDRVEDHRKMRIC